MNQQMDVLGAWALAHERELRLSPRGRAVRRRRARPADHRQPRRVPAASAVARG